MTLPFSFPILSRGESQQLWSLSETRTRFLKLNMSYLYLDSCEVPISQDLPFLFWLLPTWYYRDLTCCSDQLHLKRYTEISHQSASTANNIILTFLSSAPHVSESWGGLFHFAHFPVWVATLIQGILASRCYMQFSIVLGGFTLPRSQWNLMRCFFTSRCSAMLWRVEGAEDATYTHLPHCSHLWLTCCLTLSM